MFNTIRKAFNSAAESLKAGCNSLWGSISNAASSVKNFFSPNKAVANAEKSTISKDTPNTSEDSEEFSMIDHSMVDYGHNKSLNSASSAETLKILERSSKDALMVKAAYDIEEPAKFEAITKALKEKDVQYVKSSFDVLGRYNKGLLQAAVFEETDRITVAMAGTRGSRILSNDFLVDVQDDILLARGYSTSKASSISELNDYLLKEYATEIAAGKEIHYTGHSLGGHSANVAANDMAAKLLKAGATDTKNISSTTFDSAGGDTAHRNSAKDAGHNRSEQEICKLYQGAEVIFDARKNLINNTDYKTTANRFTVQQEKHAPLTILKKMNIVATFKEHKLDGFIEAFKGDGVILGADGKPVAWDSKSSTTPVPHDEFLFNSLAAMTPKENAGECTHRMTSYNEALNKQETIFFTQDQLAAAQKAYEVVSNFEELSESVLMVGPAPVEKSLDMFDSIYATPQLNEDTIQALIGEAMTASAA